MIHDIETQEASKKLRVPAGMEPARVGSRERRLGGDEEARIRDELGRLRTDRKFSPHTRAAHSARARHFQLLFDFAIETCARLAEMTSLDWRDINLQHRI